MTHRQNVFLLSLWLGIAAFQLAVLGVTAYMGEASTTAGFLFVGASAAAFIWWRRVARGAAEIKLLAVAKNLLTTGWTQDVEARNADGKPVTAESTKAVCWCLTGALDRARWLLGASSDVQGRAVGRVHKAISKRHGQFSTIPNWNDEAGRKQAEVIEVVTEAMV